MATQNKGIGFEPEAMSPPPGKNYLLAIAIDEYNYCPKLYNCVRDARAFIEVLTERYAFDAENIITLFDAEATRPNIHSKLKELRGRITPEDNLVIYFSGHGETEDRLGYWVPVNAHPGNEWEYFSTDEIKRRLDAIDSFHTFVIADACFSGALFTAYKSLRPGYETKRSRWGLAASHSRERALDGTAGENSPFADTLLRQLKSSERNLPIQELAAAVIRRVEEATEGQQTPVFKPLNVKGDDSGQYVFHLKANEAADWKACLEVGSLSACRAFLAKHPEGAYAKAAQARIAELDEEAGWQSAKHKDTVDAYEAYLNEYPEARHASEAGANIEKLKGRVAEEQPKKQKQQPPKVREPETARAKRQVAAPAAEEKAAWRKWAPAALGILALAILVFWGVSRFGGNGESSPTPAADGARIVKPASEGVHGLIRFEGQDYRTVRLNGKTWMADNLNYDILDSWCYENSLANCEKYGRLYTWQAAQQACNSLGPGWRLPTDKEWKSLAQSFGGYRDLVSKSNVGDPEQAYKALFQDGESSFMGQPGGYRYPNGDNNYMDVIGIYWSSSPEDDQYAWAYTLGGQAFGWLAREYHDKAFGFSCRCLQE